MHGNILNMRAINLMLRDNANSTNYKGGVIKIFKIFCSNKSEGYI